MMDYFKMAEEKLYSVGTLRLKLKNYEAAYDKEIRRTAPSGIATIDLTKPAIMSSHTVDTFDSTDRIAHYKSKIIQTREEIKDITSIAEQLPKEMYNIIRLWYFEEKPKEIIMKLLYINSTKTLYSKRNKAVRMFADIFPW